MKFRALAFSCFALMLTAGCRSPTRVHEVRYPAATMLWTEDAYEASFQAPDTVRAGRPFRVTFRTFGAGCDRKGETEIAYAGEGRRVALTPFDYTRVDGGCQPVIQRFEHEVTLVFKRPGEAVIHGYGRLRRGTAPVEELEGIMQHPVIVR
jgi:hypothetical protein